MVRDSTLRWRLFEWAQTALLAANLAWTTLCLGGYLARTMVITASLTAALLFVHALSVLGGRPATRVAAAGGHRWGGTAGHPAGWLFLPFLAYAALNVLYVTPVKWLGWFDWFGWTQMIVVFWVVLNGIRTHAAQRALGIVLFAVAVVGVLFACFQRFVRPDWLILERIQATQYIGRSSGPFGSPNSFAALLLLLLPAAGALACRRNASAIARVFFGWLTLVLLFGLGLTISRGAWLGLAVALTAWPLLAGFPGASGRDSPDCAEPLVGRRNRADRRWGRRLLASAGAFGGIVLAVTATFLASAAVRERLTQLVHDMGERSRPILWRAAWQLTREHPLIGTGGGSFDTEFERFRPEGFLNRPMWAHNDYLNTLSDYGAIGFVLFFGAAAIVVWRCVRRRAHGDGAATLGAVDSSRVHGVRVAPPRLGSRSRAALSDPLVRQGMAIGILAFALQLLVDFHLKIPALAMAFATVAALLVQRGWRVAAVLSTGDASTADPAAEPEPCEQSVPAATRITAILLAAAACGLAVYMIPRYRGEAWRQTARDRIDALVNTAATAPRYIGRIAAARAMLDRAVAAAPDNAQAWSDRAYATAQWARLSPGEGKRLGAEAQEDANRALKLAPVCAEFWIRRGVARDLQGRSDAAAADFIHAIRLAPNLTLPWFHYAYHLALRPPDRAMAVAMVAICLRLDPKNPEALRLRQHLATGRPGP